MIDYYSLLKIPFVADHNVIESAFRNFREEIMIYAPGIVLNDDEIKKQFPEIWEAYATLLDPEKRNVYDKTLRNNPSLIDKTTEEITEESDETIPLRTRLGIIASYIAFSLFILAVLYVFSRLFIL
jgi:DnaJ-class molecular chaperone